MSIQRNDFKLLVHPVDDTSSPKMLSAMTTNYNLMQLPDAITRVAVGSPLSGARRLPDNVIPRDWLDPHRLLRIVVEKTFTSPRTRVPIRTQSVVFEGYPNAPAISVGVRSGEASVYLQHWLRDLQNSSMLHEYAHPPVAKSPLFETITFPANSAGLGQGGVGIAHRMGLPSDWKANIGTDIWANGLKPMLAALATRSLDAVTRDRGFCEDLINAPSPAAADALARIQGPSATLGLAYTTAEALKLQTTGDDALNTLLNKQVGHLLGNQTFASYQGQTFWSHILKFCASMYCEIVIRPTDAFFVPAMPVSPEAFETQYLEDRIIDLKWAETTQMSVRGITVLAPEPRNRAGYRDEASRKSSPGAVQAGCFLGSENPRDGRIHTETAPYWLAETISLVDNAGASLGMMRRDPGSLEPPESRTSRDPLNIGEIFNNFARLRFLEERLRYRQATYLAPFSTDICVGSTIAVSGRSTHAGQAISNETSTFLGKVTGITHSLDRVGKRANTSYSLGSVITLEEWQSGLYTIPDHPILSGHFPGASFIAKST